MDYKKAEKEFGWVNENRLKLIKYKEDRANSKTKTKITKNGKVDYADKYINQQVSIDEGVAWVMERSVKKEGFLNQIPIKYTFKKEDSLKNIVFDKNLDGKYVKDPKGRLMRGYICGDSGKDIFPGKTIIALRRIREITYEPSVRKTLEKMNHQDGDKFVDGVLKLQAQLKSKK